MKMVAVETRGASEWIVTGDAKYRPCRNYSEFNVCNWLLPADSDSTYCIACELNEVIPSLEAPANRAWWSNLEAMKRRLVYSLLRLELPLVSRYKDRERGLAFAFLEDQRRNPNVMEEFVLTGHAEGLITVNLAEADLINREIARQSLGEAYRTLLGHFRHESGHYYFDRLIVDRDRRDDFRNIFGDERQDYSKALDEYYSAERCHDFDSEFISAYARAHPIEDWAECWAHYLHMFDTLETAAEHGLVGTDNLDDFDESRGMGGVLYCTQCPEPQHGLTRCIPFRTHRRSCQEASFCSSTGTRSHENAQAIGGSFLKASLSLASQARFKSLR